MTYTRSATLKVLEAQESREQGWRGHAQDVTAEARDLCDAKGDWYEPFVIPPDVAPLHELIENKHYTLDEYNLDALSVTELLAKMYVAMFDGNLDIVIEAIQDMALVREVPVLEIEELVNSTYKEICITAQTFLKHANTQDSINRITSVLANVDGIMEVLLPACYSSINNKVLHTPYVLACERVSRMEYVASLQVEKEVNIGTAEVCTIPAEKVKV
jgi:hypothetical protein